MVGGTISGYSATGSVSRQTAPRRTVMMAMTLARTGRSMKNFDTPGFPLCSAGRGLRFDRRRRGRLGLLGVDYSARDCLQKSFDDHAVVGRETLVDDEFLGDLRPGLDALA